MQLSCCKALRCKPIGSLIGSTSVEWMPDTQKCTIMAQCCFEYVAQRVHEPKQCMQGYSVPSTWIVGIVSSSATPCLPCCKWRTCSIGGPIMCALGILLQTITGNEQGTGLHSMCRRRATLVTLLGSHGCITHPAFTLPTGCHQFPKHAYIKATHSLPN